MMKKTAISLFSALVITSCAQLNLFASQVAVSPDLSQAYRTAETAAQQTSKIIQANLQQGHPVVDPLRPPRRLPANYKQFNLVYGGDLGPNWRLSPAPTLPSSDLFLNIDQGDRVVLTLSNSADRDWTTFQIDGIDGATIDGNPVRAIFLYFGNFMVEQRTVEFTAPKAGKYEIKALESGRINSVGLVIVH